MTQWAFRITLLCTSLREPLSSWQSPTHIPYHFTRTHGTHQAPLTSINNNTRAVASIHNVCGYSKRYLRVGELVTTFCVYGYSKRYLTVLRDVILYLQKQSEDSDNSLSSQTNRSSKGQRLLTVIGANDTVQHVNPLYFLCTISNSSLGVRACIQNR